MIFKLQQRIKTKGGERSITVRFPSLPGNVLNRKKKKAFSFHVVSLFSICRVGPSSLKRLMKKDESMFLIYQVLPTKRIQTHRFGVVQLEEDKIPTKLSCSRAPN